MALWELHQSMAALPEHRVFVNISLAGHGNRDWLIAFSKYVTLCMTSFWSLFFSLCMVVVVVIQTSSWVPHFSVGPKILGLNTAESSSVWSWLHVSWNYSEQHWFGWLDWRTTCYHRVLKNGFDGSVSLSGIHFMVGPDSSPCLQVWHCQTLTNRATKKFRYLKEKLITATNARVRFSVPQRMFAWLRRWYLSGEWFGARVEMKLSL